MMTILYYVVAAVLVLASIGWFALWAWTGLTSMRDPHGAEDAATYCVPEGGTPPPAVEAAPARFRWRGRR